ncbi:MAG: hypothetical protein F6K11_25245 [Leptolyngbya sp. SIO3F4]|nr:hypothetical protein [Leptolyngbya sp. SIO3F4]
MLMELCPCCDARLLRHASKSGSYLRCGSCQFEIPEDLPAVTNEESKTTNSLLDKIETVEAVTAS